MNRLHSGSGWKLSAKPGSPGAGEDVGVLGGATSHASTVACWFAVGCTSTSGVGCSTVATDWSGTGTKIPTMGSGWVTGCSGGDGGIVGSSGSVGSRVIAGLTITIVG